MRPFLLITALLSFGFLQLVFPNQVPDSGGADSCFSFECSSSYSSDCGAPDLSSKFSPCRSPQDACNVEIVPPNPPNMGGLRQSAVQCYCTCIRSLPFLQIITDCCGDLNLDRALNSTPAEDPDFVVTRLFSPNDDMLGTYRSSSRCNYRIQCPTEAHLLYYILVRQKIEQDPDSKECLDFLQYEFTAVENSPVMSEVCGEEVRTLPQPAQREGFHESALTVRFHSNRLKTDEGFFLSAICISPDFLESPPVDCEESIPLSELDREDETGKRRKRASTLRQPELDPERVFHVMREKRSFRVPCFTVTSSALVRYENLTVTVERGGMVLYRFKNIEVLQVYNRVEGFLTFYGSVVPSGRAFKGHGLLRIGKRIAQFEQTIVEPQFLLTDGEASIVRDLFHELFNNRRFYDSERFYFAPPDLSNQGPATPNCTWSRLADANMRSCSGVVRAAAQYFLRNEVPGVCGSPRNGTM